MCVYRVSTIVMYVFDGTSLVPLVFDVQHSGYMWWRGLLSVGVEHVNTQKLSILCHAPVGWRKVKWAVCQVG